MKTVPTIAGVAPLLLLRMMRGQSVLPPRRTLVWVVLVAALGQLGGNVAFQWALGVIGIALCVPLTLGSMIISGGLLGRGLLGDRVSRSMVVACLVLISAIVVLSAGAPRANASIQGIASQAQEPDMPRVVAAVAAACFSGFAYSCLSVMLRLAANRGVPIPSLLFTVGLTGFVVLGTAVRLRLGEFPVQTLRGVTLMYLLGAGTFNVLAFAALTKALHLSSILFVNGLGASQSAMAAVIGVLLFGEAFSAPMLVGVLLTAMGLLMMKAG
jgi:drug/metabolite transporter (DMT)-like permease